MGLTLMDEEQIEEYIAAPKQICTARFTWIFSEPTEKSGQLCDFVWGDLVRKTGVTSGKWSKVLLPDGRYGWVKTKEVCDFDKWVAGREASEQSIVSTAMKFNGIPYFWGGTSIKGVDCSGLARCTYFLNGILLPRNASHQVKCGVEIPYSEAHPGDLVFFGREATDSLPERISHVAIYLGNDKIIHSSLVVRINSLSPDGEDYYERKVLHTRRILGQQDKGTGVRTVASSRYYFNK